MASTDTFSPGMLRANLKTICERFEVGRQEDADEFLKGLLDKMQGCCPDPSPGTSETQTSYPYTVFGGTEQSSMICKECGTVSNTFAKIEDIGHLDMYIPTCVLIGLDFSICYP
jgi:ubiquitin C-terminal hydrolase